MNGLFTRFSDWFSEAMGTWPVFLFFVFLLAGWIALGVPMSWSDTWQLIANTPTTWIELFLGIATLASANRIEKRNYELHVSMQKMLKHVEQLAESEEAELDQLTKRRRGYPQRTQRT